MIANCDGKLSGVSSATDLKCVVAWRCVFSLSAERGEVTYWFYGPQLRQHEKHLTL